MSNVNAGLMLWAFVVGLFGAFGWALGHWLMGKLTGAIDKALS